MDLSDNAFPLSSFPRRSSSKQIFRERNRERRDVYGDRCVPKGMEEYLFRGSDDNVYDPVFNAGIIACNNIIRRIYSGERVNKEIVTRRLNYDINCITKSFIHIFFIGPIGTYYRI